MSRQPVFTRAVSQSRDSVRQALGETIPGTPTLKCEGKPRGRTCVINNIFLYSLDAQLLKMIISQDTHLEPGSYGADIPRDGTYDFKLDTDLCDVERMSSKPTKAAELESRH